MKEKLINSLLEYFIKESNTSYHITSSTKENRLLLRGLINMRNPLPISDNILSLEDELLQIELSEKEIIDVEDLEEIEKNISIYLGDITTLKADAIVNAGNSYGLGCFNPNHRCIDNTIHTYAGIRLRLECNNKLKGRLLENGEILVCNGYNLPSKYVITTVGPNIYNEPTEIDKEDLSKCYENALKYAIDNNLKSIVFPSISTGLFSYSISDAKYIAYETVKKVLGNNNIKVIFNLYSESDYNEYKSLFKN
jgi:O-acetyl-ADP-ribose deacetylase (regulator of RNase III)